MWVSLPQAGADENTGGLLTLTCQLKPGRVDVEHGWGPVHAVSPEPWR